MTSRQRHKEFHEVWPALERRLTHAVAALGVPHSRREDVIQETSIRLYRMWDRVDPDADPFPLARVIASRVACDEARRHRDVLAAHVETGESDRSAEAAAIARLDLEEVVQAMRRLSPMERRAVLAEIGVGERIDNGRSAFKTARMRGRQNLQAALQRAAHGLLVVRVTWAKLSRKAQALALEPPAHVAPALGYAAQVVAVAVLTGAAATPLPSAPVERRPLTVMAAERGSTPRAVTSSRGVSDAEPRAARVTSGLGAGPRSHSSPGPSAPQPGGETVAGAAAGARGTGARVERREEGTFVLVCPGQVIVDTSGGSTCEEARPDATIVYVGDPQGALPSSRPDQTPSNDDATAITERSRS